MPIERGDSWFSPKCIEVQRRPNGQELALAPAWMLPVEPLDGPGALPGYQSQPNSEWQHHEKAAVRRPGISLVVERETAQTLC